MNRCFSFAASVLVFFVGSFAIAHFTDHGAAWTTESARKIDIQRSPRQLPASSLTDTSGGASAPSDFKKQIQLVDFIYTECPTTCVGLGLEFKRLQSDLVTLGLSDKVQLISISFDIENDSPHEISAYLSRFNARVDQWDAYVFSSKSGMQSMLDKLEITVIPDENVGFIHNAAIYLVQDGFVKEIFDYKSKETLLNRLSEYLG